MGLCCTIPFSKSVNMPGLSVSSKSVNMPGLSVSSNGVNMHGLSVNSKKIKIFGTYKSEIEKFQELNDDEYDDNDI
jgi:hypothetical protein